VDFILGPPHGLAQFPTGLFPFVDTSVEMKIEPPAETATAWSYSQHAGPNLSQLVVYFDSTGTLIGKVIRTRQGMKLSVSQSW
jgi:hypothetical protein